MLRQLAPRVLYALRQPILRTRLTTVSNLRRPIRQIQPIRPFTITQIHHSELPNLLDDTTKPQITIGKVLNKGFVLFKEGNPDHRTAIRGPIIVSSNNAWLWDLSVEEQRDIKQWKADRLAIIETMDPPPTLLLLGTGERMVVPPPQILQRLKERNIQLEVLTTKNASSTFNVLAEEGRDVVAVLLPIEPAVHVEQNHYANE